LDAAARGESPRAEGVGEGAIGDVARAGGVGENSVQGEIRLGGDVLLAEVVGHFLVGRSETTRVTTRGQRGGARGEELEVGGSHSVTEESSRGSGGTARGRSSGQTRR